MKQSANESGKLSLVTKIAYGCGDLASQFVWTFVGSYLSIFYTDVVGLAPAIASVIMLVARLGDGAFDPCFGAVAERTHSRWGRFRPYILFGAPVLAILDILAFTSPSFGNVTAFKIVWAAVIYTILGFMYSVVNLSYGSLSTCMTYDSEERVQLNSWRMIGTNLGGVLLNAISMPLILFFSHSAKATAHGYTMTAIIFALISLPLFFFVFITSREVVKPVSHQKVKIGVTIKSVLTNRPLMIIFFIMLFSMTGFFGRMGVVIYYLMYNVHNYSMIALFMMIPSLFAAIAIFVTKNFVEKIGKKKMCFIAYIGNAIVLFLIYLTPVSNIPLLLVLHALYGIFTFAFPIPMAMVPEAIDYQEDTTGVRSDGTSYAVVSLSTKIASAVGGSVGLAIMGAFGYIANGQQTASALNGINVTVNIVPAICYLLAVIPMALYPLTKEKCAAIHKSLQQKAQLANKDERAAVETK